MLEYCINYLDIHFFIHVWKFCCHQRNKILYTGCRLWWCLICICHMYWQQTHGVSKFLCIVHTIILQTKSIHKKLSINTGIVPLRHFPYTRSFTNSPPTFLMWWILFLIVSIEVFPRDIKIATYLPLCVSFMMLLNRDSKDMVGDDTYLLGMQHLCGLTSEHVLPFNFPPFFFY